jgi:hypothetical protein
MSYILFDLILSPYVKSVKTVAFFSLELQANEYNRDIQVNVIRGVNRYMDRRRRLKVSDHSSKFSWFRVILKWKV